MPGPYGQASTVADTWLPSYSWGGGGGGVNSGTSGQGSTQDPATGNIGSAAGGGVASVDGVPVAAATVDVTAAAQSPEARQGMSAR
jgi:hypothetical protein